MGWIRRFLRGLRKPRVEVRQTGSDAVAVIVRPWLAAPLVIVLTANHARAVAAKIAHATGRRDYVIPGGKWCARGYAIRVPAGYVRRLCTAFEIWECGYLTGLDARAGR